MKRFSSRWLLLTCILTLAFGLRFIGTNKIPIGISDDELDYYLSGKCLALSGSDCSGTWDWWRLTPIVTGTYTAEATAILYLPIAKLFPATLAFAKLTPALIGTATVLIIYILGSTLTKNTTTGLLAASTLAFNPWHILFSRTGFEVTIALFWLTLSITLFLKSVSNHKPGYVWLAGSILTLGLGYYSYHGFKFIVLPLALIAAAYGYSSHRSKVTVFKVSIYGIIPVLLLARSLITPSLTQRQNELLTPNTDYVVEQVNYYRKIAPVKPLARLLENKYLETTKTMLANYVAFFSPTRLFISATDNVNLDFSVHGYLYLIELLPLAAGLHYSVTTKRYWLPIGLLLISPLPSVIHVHQSYAIRSQFALVPLAIIIAIGWQRVIAWTNSHKIPSTAWLALMAISISYATYTYTNRFSITASDQYMLNHRLVSTYLSRKNPQQQTVILTQEPYQLFRSYLFYGDIINKNNIAYLQAQFREQGIWGDYRLGQVLVTGNCDFASDSNTLIIDERIIEKCGWRHNQAPSIALGSPVDSHAYYTIYEDSLCHDVSSFVHISDLSSLDIEHLTNAQFCQTWAYQT